MPREAIVWSTLSGILVGNIAGFHDVKNTSMPFKLNKMVPVVVVFFFFFLYSTFNHLLNKFVQWILYETNILHIVPQIQFANLIDFFLYN